MDKIVVGFNAGFIRRCLSREAALLHDFALAVDFARLEYVAELFTCAILNSSEKNSLRLGGLFYFIFHTTASESHCRRVRYAQ